MNPCRRRRLEMTAARLRTASFSPSARLYCEMSPQTAIRPCTRMLSRTASSMAPPTFSK
uniref:Uncharacterized protein n=1 Tax=Zea mays TaxID=4577 RepID=C0HHP7_MAIZE|nr:unknown [Zea mays]